MPKPKGAGDLRQRVRFERRGSGDLENGNPQGDWGALGLDRWCSLTPTRGGESVQAGRVAGSAMWDLWVRNDSGTRSINEADRVVNVRDPSQTFAIVFGPSDMDGTRTWLFLQLRAGGADD